MEETMTTAALARLEKEITNLKHTVYGNGKTGLDEEVRGLKKDLNMISNSFDNLNNAIGKLNKRLDQKDTQELELRSQFKGAKWAFGIAGTIVITLGSILGGQILTLLKSILDQL